MGSATGESLVGELKGGDGVMALKGLGGESWTAVDGG